MIEKNDNENIESVTALKDFCLKRPGYKKINLEDAIRTLIREELTKILGDKKQE